MSLFETSIGAFLRSGAVSQLVITLASLPALLERLDQPGAARTLLAAMPTTRRASTTSRHSPSSSERLDARLGSEAVSRSAATGAAFDLPDAAAFAMHRIDVARKVLARPPVWPAG